MKKADRAVSVIRMLTGLTMALSALPILWLLGMFVVALVVNPAGGVQLIAEMPLLALQLVCAAVIIVQTILRLTGRRYAPRALLIAGMAEAALTVALLFLADDALDQGILWLLAGVAAALLLLNCLWSWLAGRIPADAPEAAEERVLQRRTLFGPRPATWRGCVASAAEYGLVVLCVLSVLPAALWLMIVIAALFAGGAHMDAQAWLVHGALVLCFGNVALTVLRLEGRWWSPWAFYGAAAAAMALTAAQIRLMGEAESGFFVQEQITVLAVQTLLHIVWSAAGKTGGEGRADPAETTEEETKV